MDLIFICHQRWWPADSLTAAPLSCRPCSSIPQIFPTFRSFRSTCVPLLSSSFPQSLSFIIPIITYSSILMLSFYSFQYTRIYFVLILPRRHSAPRFPQSLSLIIFFITFSSVVMSFLSFRHSLIYFVLIWLPSTLSPSLPTVTSPYICLHILGYIVMSF